MWKKAEGHQQKLGFVQAHSLRFTLSGLILKADTGQGDDQDCIQCKSGLLD